MPQLFPSCKARMHNIFNLDIALPCTTLLWKASMYNFVDLNVHFLHTTLLKPFPSLKGNNVLHFQFKCWCFLLGPISAHSFLLPVQGNDVQLFQYKCEHSSKGSITSAIEIPTLPIWPFSHLSFSPPARAKKYISLNMSISHTPTRTHVRLRTMHW